MRPLHKWAIRLIAAATIVGALAYVPYRVYGSDGYVHYRRLQHDLRRLDEGNAELRIENERLRRDIGRLDGHDLDAIGAVARDELGLVGPGEVVIQIEGRSESPRRP